MTPIVFVWFPGGPEDQLSVNCWLPPHFAWLQGHTCKHVLWQRLYVGLLTNIKPVIRYNAHILLIRILSLSCKEIQQKVYGAWFYFTRNSLLSHIELTRGLELLGFSPPDSNSQCCSRSTASASPYFRSSSKSGHCSQTTHLPEGKYILDLVGAGKPYFPHQCPAAAIPALIDCHHGSTSVASVHVGSCKLCLQAAQIMQIFIAHVHNWSTHGQPDVQQSSSARGRLQAERLDISATATAAACTFHYAARHSSDVVTAH